MEEEQQDIPHALQIGDASHVLWQCTLHGALSAPCAAFLFAVKVPAAAAVLPSWHRRHSKGSVTGRHSICSLDFQAGPAQGISRGHLCRVS